MTVSYASSVATVHYGSLLRLLLRWHGSVYQAVWPPFLLFCLAYGIVALSYYLLPTDTLEQLQVKKQFLQVCAYASHISNAIPVSFVLGFFVNLVVSRWWKQFLNLPTPDSVCYLMNAYLRDWDIEEKKHMTKGELERPLLFRRSIARYLNLASALCFQSISLSMKRQVGSLEELVDCGLMTKQEEAIYLGLSQDNPYFFIPLVWSVTLLTRAHYEGFIVHSRYLDSMVGEVVAFWRQLQTLFLHDYVNVPLVYNQVVTLVVYVYVGVLVLSHQFRDPEGILKEFEAQLLRSQQVLNGTFNSTTSLNGTLPLAHGSALDVVPNIPVFALLALMFYTGWLRVAESSVFPFAEDDDNFEVIPLLERNISMGMWFVDSSVANRRLSPELVRTGCRPTELSEEVSQEYVDRCLAAAGSQEAMGWKGTARESERRDALPIHTSVASFATQETTELPCPTELRHRESKYFGTGSLARICDEQKDNWQVRRFSRPKVSADPNMLSVSLDDESTYAVPSRRSVSSVGNFFSRLGARVSYAVNYQPSVYTTPSSAAVEDPLVAFQRVTSGNFPQSHTISALGAKTKYV